MEMKYLANEGAVYVRDCGVGLGVFKHHAS